MVYESDFYTTRRPYSRPSPTISSYSVTAQTQPFHRNLPFVAHKRLTAPQAPPPRSKVRNSVLMAEIDRINHRVRPHPAYVPTEDWLNSACSVVHPYPQFSASKMMRFMVLPLTYKMKNLDSSVPERFRYAYKDNFDDETRSIRAQTAALLKRVHCPVPRSRGPLHAVLPTPSSLMETPIPHRHTSDYYIEGLLAPITKVQRDVTSRSFYVEHPRPYIGKGNLACVSFAGGRAYAKRRGHYDVPADHHNVQDDIATLSYYNRARAVANGQEPGPEPAATTSRKSRPYRSTTDSAPAPAPRADSAAASASAPAPSPASRPAAAPIRQASVKEDPAAEAAAEAEDTAVAVTNGVVSEEDEADAEAARLAAEEAELERQLEAELRAEMEAKDAKKAKKAAAKKAKEDEEAAAAAAAAAAAQAAAAAAAEAEAAAAAEAARKAAEEEAELERLVAAELEAERLAAEALKAEEEQAAAAAEAAALVEPAEEVSIEQESNDAEAEAPATEEAELEPEPTPEPADEVEAEAEPEPEPEPAVAEAEPEPEEEAEPEAAASPEPEAIAEDDPVVEEPASEALRDEAEEAKSDEDAGWPMDDE